MRLVLLCLFLSGCVSVQVETPDCRASYTSIGRDVAVAEFAVCNGAARVANVQSEKIVPTLKDLLLRIK